MFQLFSLKIIGTNAINHEVPTSSPNDDSEELTKAEVVCKESSLGLSLRTLRFVQAHKPRTAK